MNISREHLELLSENFRNIDETTKEIINLEAILSLPKGTEHFLSDIHGEYEAFDHILRNGSGVIKEKLKEVFGNRLPKKELNLLATIIYYPEEKLNLLKKEFSTAEYKEYQKILLLRLLEVTQVAARKYTRSKVRKLLPKDFDYIIEELLYKMQTRDKEDYYEKILENIIEFDEKVAREIMIPRTKVFLIDKNISVDELFEKKEVEVYSRIPVYEDEADNIVGILFMKDLMIEAYRKGFQNVKLTEIMQEAYFVPETKNVNELFNEMQAEKKHIAILIDEYGGFSGIVTLEDLIEEVMGNIADEFDADDSSIKKLAANKYFINGELSLNDLNDYFHIELESKHYDTLSGLLIEHMGYIPEDDEDIAPIIIDGISFKPKRVKDKKIEWVLAKFNKEENLN